MTELSQHLDTKSRKHRPPPARKNEGEPPICKICGELIPRLEGDANCLWLRRKVCRPEFDTKEVKCMKIHINSTNKNRAKIRKQQKQRQEYKKPVSNRQSKAAAAIRKNELLDREMEMQRLDNEQIKLNKQIDATSLHRSEYAKRNITTILSRFGCLL